MRLVVLVALCHLAACSSHRLRIRIPNGTRLRMAVDTATPWPLFVSQLAERLQLPSALQLQGRHGACSQFGPACSDLTVRAGDAAGAAMAQHIAHGVAHLEAWRLLAAAQEFGAAVKLCNINCDHPTQLLAVSYGKMGMVHERRGEHHSASEAYQQASMVQPTWGTWLVRAGGALRSGSDNQPNVSLAVPMAESAIALLQTAAAAGRRLQQFDIEAAAWLQQGLAYNSIGMRMRDPERLGQAQECYRQQMLRLGSSHEDHVIRAQTEYKLGVAASYRRHFGVHSGQQCPATVAQRWVGCQPGWRLLVSASVGSKRSNVILFATEISNGQLAAALFVEDTELELQTGDSAAMGHRAAALLAGSTCEIGGTEVAARVVWDRPYSVQLLCGFGVLQHSAMHEVSIRLPNLGTTTIRLCSSSTRPAVRAAICTQPLWRPPESMRAARFDRLLKEWIRYHQLLGVERIYMYDRHDALEGLVAEFGDLVHRIAWPAFNAAVSTNITRRGEYYDQVLAHNACLMRHRHQSDWLLFLDPDEFLHFGGALGGTAAVLQSWLASQSEQATELSIKNMVFGGLAEQSGGLTIERFTHRSEQHEVFGKEKFFVRPNATHSVWVHHSSQLKCGTVVSVPPEELRANHYVHSLEDPQADPVHSDRSTSQIRADSSRRALKQAVAHDSSAVWAVSMLTANTECEQVPRGSPLLSRYAQALESLKASKSSEAVAGFDFVRRSTPGCSDVHKAAVSALAIAYRQLGHELVLQHQPGGAQEAYRAAVSLAPDCIQCFISYGNALLEHAVGLQGSTGLHAGIDQSKLEGALGAYDQAMRLSTNPGTQAREQAEAWYGRGNVYSVMAREEPNPSAAVGHFKAADTHFSKVLQINPSAHWAEYQQAWNWHQLRAVPPWGQLAPAVSAQEQLACPAPNSRPPQSVWSMCRGTARGWTGHPLAAGAHLMVLEADADPDKLEILVFVQPRVPQIFDGDAVQLLALAEQTLQGTQCMVRRDRFFPPSSPVRINASIHHNRPLSVIVRCEWKGQQTVMEGAPRAQVSLQLASGETVPIQLCKRRLRKRRHVAVCVQPLWLSSDWGKRQRFSELVRQWLLYHELLGSEHFYIYDRYDALEPLLRPFARRGLVTRLLFNPLSEQMLLVNENSTIAQRSTFYDQVLAHNACLMRHRHQSDWLLFLDPDEFLHFGGALGGTAAVLQSWLASQSEQATELSIKNMVFGGLAEQSGGLTIERFTQRYSKVEPNSKEKFFVRPQNTQAVWIHGVTSFKCGRRWTAPPDELRVNHYFNAVQEYNTSRNKAERWDESNLQRDNSASWSTLWLEQALKKLGYPPRN